VRTLELRRHATRDPAADRLSRQGRAQAQSVGATLAGGYSVVFVSPAERTAWPEIRETFRRLRRAEDDFVYEPVVVGSFEDAVLAVVFNANLQAVGCLFQRPVASY